MCACRSEEVCGKEWTSFVHVHFELLLLSEATHDPVSSKIFTAAFSSADEPKTPFAGDAEIKPAAGQFSHTHTRVTHCRPPFLPFHPVTGPHALQVFAHTSRSSLYHSRSEVSLHASFSSAHLKSGSSGKPMSTHGTADGGGGGETTSGVDEEGGGGNDTGAAAGGVEAPPQTPHVFAHT